MTILALAAGAALPAGCGGDPRDAAPAALASGLAWFEERAAERGIAFVHASGHGDQYLMPEIACGGAALLDIDGDGDLDAYLVQSGRFIDAPADRPGNRLYRNRGDGTFEDITEGSGADDRGYGIGVAAGDYDGDGDVDLYVTNVGPNVLLRNEGNGRFRDVTAEAGVGDPGFGASAAFFDGDLDGDLDLVTLNYLHWSIASELDCYNTLGMTDYCGPQSYEAPASDVLYRNEGDGTFVDATELSGFGAALGTGLGVVCADLNGDGWPDVFVANDGMPDHLWINHRDGTYNEEAMFLGCALDLRGRPKAGMGVTIADIDDDRDLDLLVGNLTEQSDSLFRNDGAYFSDVTTSRGLGAVSRAFTRFGMAWLDFDNDGYLDLYQANGRVRRESTSYGDDPYAEPNLLFRGREGGFFTEVLPRGGTTPELVGTSRAAAFGDVDGDGGIDILVVNRDGPAHLLMNVVPDRGHWLGLRVVDEAGRDAIGARVEIALGARTATRSVRRAYSYCASNEARVHFGLGAESAVEAIVVQWPDGRRETFPGAVADRVVTLRRGAGSPP